VYAYVVSELQVQFCTKKPTNIKHLEQYLPHSGHSIFIEQKMSIRYRARQLDKNPNTPTLSFYAYLSIFAFLFYKQDDLSESFTFLVLDIKFGLKKKR
jgi:hypothetical protein